MKNAISWMLETLSDETGATMVEYALMLALIAVLCIVAVTSIGRATNNSFTQAESYVR